MILPLKEGGWFYGWVLLVVLFCFLISLCSPENTESSNVCVGVCFVKQQILF